MPSALTVASAEPAVSSRDRSPSQVLRTPVFWLMFAMMTMMATSGLMVTSQMASFAADFGISNAVVFGLAAVPLALTIDRFCNGLTRPLFGFISDRIGREQTMFIAFSLEAVAMTLWLTVRSDPPLFVLLSGVVFLGWGEIFFPLSRDFDRHVRRSLRNGQLRLAVHLVRRRLRFRRSARRLAASTHGKLGPRVWHGDYARCADCITGVVRPETVTPADSREQPGRRGGVRQLGQCKSDVVDLNAGSTPN